MDLRSYIQQLLQQGYQPAAIKEMLLKYGYPEQQVDRALYTVEVKHTHHLAPAVLAVLVLLIVGTGTVGYFLFTQSSQGVRPGELLDVSVSAPSPAAPGSSLPLTIYLSNMGSKGRYDVLVRAEIRDSAGKILAVKSETVALETSKTHSLSLSIPPDASGRATVVVTASYASKTAEAEQQISIAQPSAQQATCYDGIRNQAEEEVDCGGSCRPCKECPLSCDDSNSATIDYCGSTTNYECRHDTQAVCGDSSCQPSESTSSCPGDCPPANTPWEEMERIKQVQDLNEARQQCQTLGIYTDKCLQNIGQIHADASTCGMITDEFPRDKCFDSVAKSTKDKVLCEQISKENRRDTCYITFALDGDYTVCEMLADKYLKNSCDSLKMASASQARAAAMPQSQEFNQETPTS
ncbi:MAG: hypothetical protein Q7S65_06065 [Nanoarchaeota archaeon]|nr:hypothetical protein [Nanoarchaeota archaeon]